MITRTKANNLLEQLVASTASNGQKTYYYIGLSTTTPREDGSNFTEPIIPDGAVDDEGNNITTNEYQRVSLDGLMGSPSNAIIKNTAIIFFNEAEHYGWGKITHFGIFNAKTGGVPIFYGEVPETDIPKNYIPIFRAGKLQIGLDNDPANPVTP